MTATFCWQFPVRHGTFVAPMPFFFPLGDFGHCPSRFHLAALVTFFSQIRFFRLWRSRFWVFKRFFWIIFNCFCPALSSLAQLCVSLSTTFSKTFLLVSRSLPPQVRVLLRVVQVPLWFSPQLLEPPLCLFVDPHLVFVILFTLYDSLRLSISSLGLSTPTH